MFCPKCGAENPDGVAFCRGCGAKFDQTASGSVASGSVSDEKTDDAADAANPSKPAADEKPLKKSKSDKDKAKKEKKPKEKKPKKPRKKLSKKAKIGIAAVVAVAVVGGGVGFLLHQQHVDFVNAVQPNVYQAVKDKYNGQTELFAKNDYIEPSKYKVQSVDVSGLRKNGDKVEGTVTADIVNDSFDSKAELEFSADIDTSNKLSNASIKVASSETTPVTGVTKDDKRGFENAYSDLSEDGKTCTATYIADAGDNWVMKSGTSHDATYTFDGTKWKFVKDKKGGKETEVGDIDGTYKLEGGSTDDDGKPVTYLTIEDCTNDSIGTLKWHSYYKIKGEPGDLIASLKGDVTAYSDVDPIELKDFGNGYYGFDFERDDASTSNNYGAKVQFRVIFNPDQEGSLKMFKTDDMASADEKIDQYIVQANYRHGQSMSTLEDYIAGVCGIPDDFNGGQSSFNDSHMTYVKTDDIDDED